MAKKKPQIISQTTVGFLDISINGKSILGGGASYSRTEDADGRVVETGIPIQPQSIDEAIQIALAGLSSPPETPAVAGAAGTTVHVETTSKRRSRGRP